MLARQLQRFEGVPRGGEVAGRVAAEVVEQALEGRWRGVELLDLFLLGFLGKLGFRDLRFLLLYFFLSWLCL